LIINLVITPVYLFLILIALTKARNTNRDLENPRFVFGSTPVINFSHWSKLLSASGYTCSSFVNEVYRINQDQDWDIVREHDKWRAFFPLSLLLDFCNSLSNYDIYVMSCDGFLIGQTKLWRLQRVAFKFCRCKSVVLPYGADAYVYSKVKSNMTLHGLMISYPQAARNQRNIEKRVDYWVKYADIFIPGMMGLDGFGRWDTPTPSMLQIDLELWEPSRRKNFSSGKNGEVVIGHSSNHRGFKGTDTIKRVVEELKQEGLEVKFLALEGRQNSEVREILQSEVDILVEQLLFTGYALSAIEGMACQLPVITNMEDSNALNYLNVYSFLGSHPLVSASSENLKEKLRELIVNPELRVTVGRKSRGYVERHHSQAACTYLFKSIIRKLNDKDFDLQSIYMPNQS